MQDFHINADPPTPTPTPTPTITPTPSVTATPTPTPTLRKHRTQLVQLPIGIKTDENNNTTLGFVTNRQKSTYVSYPTSDEADKDNISVLGILPYDYPDSNPTFIPLPRNIDDKYLLIDVKPSLKNTNYINQNPNSVLCFGLEQGIGDPLGLQYHPGSIQPPTDVSKNENRELYNRFFKCNISKNGDLFFVPRLKTGIAIYDKSKPTYDPASPQRISPIVDNYVFGDYRNSSITEAVVATAFYSQNNLDLLFLALVDDIGNGRIAIMDAKTTNLKFLSDIKFPVDNQSNSDVDILFEIYIRTKRLIDDNLIVNMAGSSGKKAVRIYKLSDLIRIVSPPVPPPPPVTATPTPTITVTPTITPTPGLTEYRYTRKNLVLENLVPCNRYELTLEFDSGQYGDSVIQILDFSDIRVRNYDNSITFEAQNYQNYLRLADCELKSAFRKHPDANPCPIGQYAGLAEVINGDQYTWCCSEGTTPSADFDTKDPSDEFRCVTCPGSDNRLIYDDKSYQTIHYTIYHNINLDTGILRYTLKNLDTGKVITETRVIKCKDKVECNLPRVVCADHTIKNIVQNPDGTIEIFVAIDNQNGFASEEELKEFIDSNKCCEAVYSINDGEWKNITNSLIVSCDTFI